MTGKIIKPGQRLTKQKQNPQRVNETKAGSFEKINKIDRLLAKLTKREKTQINKTRDENQYITMDINNF